MTAAEYQAWSKSSRRTSVRNGDESAARQRIVSALLPPETYTADPHGFHVWITLPEGWTRSAFASQGRSAGLGVVASDPFCVAGPPPEVRRLVDRPAFAQWAVISRMSARAVGSPPER